MPDDDESRGTLAFGPSLVDPLGCAGVGLARQQRWVGEGYPSGWMVSARRVSNGWVVDDGRGYEAVARTAEEAAGMLLGWMRRVEVREQQRGGEGLP